MRQITRDIATAFRDKKARKVKNTETDGKEIRLHGQRIVWKQYLPDGSMVVCYTQAGWPTNTTHERLNGIARIMRHDVRFYRADGIGCCTADDMKFVNSDECVFVFDELTGEFVAAYDRESLDGYYPECGETAHA